MTQQDRDRLVALQKAKKGPIKQKEAAAEIGQSERHVLRLLKSLKGKGDAVFRHGLRGRRFAFQLLYERHWCAVYRFAWLLTSSVPDAEDITQKSFLALIRKTAFFDPARAQLRTWLIAIASNQHLQPRRHLTREDATADVEKPIAGAALDEELIRLERAESLRRAIEALPTPQREEL
jgi:RNA polymerase sigma factor (sigma-70 family)